MPRKLLRVALVAAVIPALTPVLLSAQTKVGSSVRTAASTPASKPTSLSLWQRLRGQKPEPVAKAGVARLVPVSEARTAAATAAPSGEAVNLEAGSRVPGLRMPATRVRPTFEQLEGKAVATPVAKPAPTSNESFFPDDAPKARSVPQATVAQQPVATPVEAALPAAEAVAFPINSASPPQGVTAEFNAPQGQVAEYDRTSMMTPEGTDNDVSFGPTAPATPISRAMNGMTGAVPPGTPAYAVPVGPGGPVGITRVDGALYPSPMPGIPFDVGTTMITNPALDPHEMLYAHRYRGLYGPFYHKTHRHWFMTPFGICKKETRVLVGTEVRVNYKSHISPFSLYFPPVTH